MLESRSTFGPVFVAAKADVWTVEKRVKEETDSLSHTPALDRLFEKGAVPM